jgi:hypothetical protein
MCVGVAGRTCLTVRAPCLLAGACAVRIGGGGRVCVRVCVSVCVSVCVRVCVGVCVLRVPFISRRRVESGVRSGRKEAVANTYRLYLLQPTPPLCASDACTCTCTGTWTWAGTGLGLGLGLGCAYSHADRIDAHRCIPHALLSPSPLQAHTHVLPSNQHTRPRACPQLYTTPPPPTTWLDPRGFARRYRRLACDHATRYVVTCAIRQATQSS